MRRLLGVLTAPAAMMIISAACLAQGTAGFEVLRLQTFPRGASLGGSMVADSGHIESVYYNPAGLTGVQRRTAACGYMNYLLDIQSGYVAYVEPRNKHGVWGGSILYINYGKFDGRSETGVEQGIFSARDWVFGLSYANTIQDRYGVGISGKFVYSKIANFIGTAAAFDLGAQMDLMPGRLRLGAGLYNLGWTVNAYADTRDKLPTYFRMGVSGLPTGFPGHLYLSMTVLNELADNYSLNRFNGSKFFDFLGDAIYGFGVEFVPVETFFLRVGYDTQGLNQRVGTRDDAFAGISGGLGFDLNIAKVDLGMASYGEMGPVTRSSITVSF